MNVQEEKNKNATLQRFSLEGGQSMILFFSLKSREEKCHQAETP